MLTWAIALLMLKDKTDNGLWIIGAMIGDVSMVYYIASAISCHKL